MLQNTRPTAAAADSEQRSATRTSEEVEAISAEGRDYFREGYEYADSYVQRWKAGKIALGAPIEEQPQTALANKLWRQGFNRRIHEHMTTILSRSGLGAVGEVDRWQMGVAQSLSKLPEDWRLIGARQADQYINDWRLGRLALGKRVEGQPGEQVARVAWREGFEGRVEQHYQEIKASRPAEAASAEIERWRRGIAAALSDS